VSALALEDVEFEGADWPGATLTMKAMHKKLYEQNSHFSSVMLPCEFIGRIVRDQIRRSSDIDWERRVLSVCLDYSTVTDFARFLG